MRIHCQPIFYYLDKSATPGSRTLAESFCPMSRRRLRLTRSSFFELLQTWGSCLMNQEPSNSNWYQKTSFLNITSQGSIVFPIDSPINHLQAKTPRSLKTPCSWNTSEANVTPIWPWVVETSCACQSPNRQHNSLLMYWEDFLSLVPVLILSANGKTISLGHGGTDSTRWSLVVLENAKNSQYCLFSTRSWHTYFNMYVLTWQQCMSVRGEATQRASSSQKKQTKENSTEKVCLFNTSMFSSSILNYYLGLGLG